MRILIVNVNTTDAITQAIARQARSVAAPGTQIIGLTPWFGAESVEGNFESYLSQLPQGEWCTQIYCGSRPCRR